MARLCILAFVVLSFIFVSIDLAVAAPTFTVFGKVYCDNCRAGFETNITQYLEGAKVKLQCKHFENGKVEHTVDGITEKDGNYKLELKDNHENEICEVSLVESPVKNCVEIDEKRNSARVVLSTDTGITSNERFANPLGFLMDVKDVPRETCNAVMQMYTLGQEE